MSNNVKQPNQHTSKKKSKSNIKDKKKKKIHHVKKWLETPQDWAEFDAWAEKNAKPKKYIIPPPVKRCEKPLRLLFKYMCCLARPKYDFGENQCVEKVLCKSVLNFKASPRLIRLARPICRETGQDCKEWDLTCGALLYVASKRIINLSKPKTQRNFADCRLGTLSSKLAGKVRSFERTKLLSLPRIRKSECLKKTIRCGKLREFSEWMEYLALPSYKNIKDNDSKQATAMKIKILNQVDLRGKEAFEEQMRKEGIEIEIRQYDKDDKNAIEAEKNREKRRIEQDAWRFTDSSCKEFPPPVSKSAMRHKASKMTIQLSQPRKRKYIGCRKDPLKVKESAKTAYASERLNSLAQPKFQSPPVTRDVPRKRNKYDEPIFEIPVHQRILPKAKKYKLVKCKEDLTEAEREEIEQNRIQQEKKRRAEYEKNRCIDPIAMEPTIDPLFDPVGARKQAKERKRAMERLKTVN